MDTLVTLLHTWWSASRLFRLGLSLLMGSALLDGLYHFVLLLPLSEEAQQYLFPLGGPTHILILVGLNVMLAGIMGVRKARPDRPIINVADPRIERHP